MLFLPPDFLAGGFFLALADDFAVDFAFAVDLDVLADVFLPEGFPAVVARLEALRLEALRFAAFRRRAAALLARLDRSGRFQS